MKYIVLLICLWIFCPVFAGKKFRVVFYNTENLFDTRNDSLTLDDEFTPWGTKHWTTDRYHEKLLHLAQAIREAGGATYPDIVGLAEVENERVVRDLTEKTALADGDYGIIHQDSPDRRGIDVALIYRKEIFRPLFSDYFPVPFPESPSLHTRDILYVKGMFAEDTVHFFVCHFPSMSGGEAESEWKRVRAATVVRERIDSIQAVYPPAAIVVMGDLNGKADTEAQKVLRAKNSDERIEAGELYNTGYYLLKKAYGSYRFRGEWQTIDHILVSGTLLDGKQALRADRRLTVFSAPFLLEEDKNHYGFRPLPTYRGLRYTGGYSDHLPVFIDLYAF